MCFLAETCDVHAFIKFSLAGRSAAPLVTLDPDNLSESSSFRFVGLPGACSGLLGLPGASRALRELAWAACGFLDLPGASWNALELHRASWGVLTPQLDPDNLSESSLMASLNRIKPYYRVCLLKSKLHS